MFTKIMQPIYSRVITFFMEQQTTYINTLQEVLAARQSANQSYSLRAFSRDLGMHPSTLSQVLNGKKNIPKKNMAQVLENLALSPVEETLFRENYYRRKTRLDNIQISQDYYQRKMVDETNYNILAEWEYYALLTLVETDDFVSTVDFISKRLKITKERTREVIKGLTKAGLLAYDENEKLVLTNGPLRTTEDISSKALKKSHKETLDMSKTKLDEIEVELRDFSSMTVAVNPEKLQEAKTVIREFRQKLASLLRDGEKTEVYQLAIQLYPLTETLEKDL